MEKLKSGLDDITNFASPDWYLSMEKYKSGRVRISIFSWKISNPDVSGFSFINEKFQIQTCPDFNFGHVRISIFQLRNFKSGRVRNSIPDTSGFQFFNWEISNPDASGFQFRTSDSILLIWQLSTVIWQSLETIKTTMIQQQQQQTIQWVLTSVQFNLVYTFL